MAHSIENYPLPLVFKKILHDNLKGKLLIKSHGMLKNLFIGDGQLQFASSNLVQDRLVEVLYLKGILTRRQLQRINQLQLKSGEKIGKLLVREKMLSRQELFAGLKEQVKTIGVSVFSMDMGEWLFVPGSGGVPGGQAFPVPLEELIIDGVHSIDRFDYYREHFNARAPVALPIPEKTGQLLCEDDIRFYVRLSTCGTVSSEQIHSILNISSESFWQRMCLLYTLNIIDFTEFIIDSGLNKDIETLAYLYDRLKSRPMDHYELLNLKDTASVTEVKERYFSYTKKYGAGLAAPPGSRLRAKVDFVMRKVDEAYSTLSNEKSKKEYDTCELGTRTKICPDPGGAKGGTKGGAKGGSKNNAESARKLYSKAHGLYKRKQFYEAIRLLDKAIRLDSMRPSYFLLLGLCQLWVPALRYDARQNLEKVAAMEPWNADPVFYLGQLYWMERFYKKAEEHFRKALKINMEHTMASKMLHRMEKGNHFGNNVGGSGN